MMITNDNSTTMQFYVKVQGQTFGPYCSRSLAEMAIAAKTITIPEGTFPQIVEQTSMGQEMLLG